jgi:hypothetical protein
VHIYRKPVSSSPCAEQYYSIYNLHMYRPSVKEQRHRGSTTERIVTLSRTPARAVVVLSHLFCKPHPARLAYCQGGDGADPSVPAH